MNKLNDLEEDKLKNEHSKENCQRIENLLNFEMATITMTMPVQQNPSAILYTDQFPDMLQYCSTENSKNLFEILSEANNLSLVNKKGTLGGYTALHWMCIKNELDLIEFLILKCKADVNFKANLGETPLFICIK